MNTREVAQHLFAYGAFLRAERERMEGLYQSTGLECFSEGLSALDSKVEAVQEMANELWEMKENIGPSEDQP